MKALGKIDNHYLFAPRKKEQTDIAIDRISELLQTEFNYIGITSPTDTRINGYKDLIEGIKIDWKRYNLIIVTI